MPEFVNTIDLLGDDVVVDSIIDRTITEFKDNIVTKVEANAFNGCEKLVYADLPAVTVLGDSAFSDCTTLNAVHAPLVTAINAGTFWNCAALTSIDLPLLTSVKYNAFAGSGLVEADFPKLSAGAIQVFNACKSLRKVNLPALTYVDTNMFASCSNLDIVDFTSATWFKNAFMKSVKLTKLLIRNEIAVPTLADEGSGTTLKGVLNTSGGYIYVPKSLIDGYKTATNWSILADKFRALEDYTVDGTVTGELDESKI